jgi:hypothetical protein
MLLSVPRWSVQMRLNHLLTSPGLLTPALPCIWRLIDSGLLTTSHIAFPYVLQTMLLSTAKALEQLWLNPQISRFNPARWQMSSTSLTSKIVSCLCCILSPGITFASRLRALQCRSHSRAHCASQHPFAATLPISTLAHHLLLKQHLQLARPWRNLSGINACVTLESIRLSLWSRMSLLLVSSLTATTQLLASASLVFMASTIKPLSLTRHHIAPQFPLSAFTVICTRYQHSQVQAFDTGSHSLMMPLVIAGSKLTYKTFHMFSTFWKMATQRHNQHSHNYCSTIEL